MNLSVWGKQSHHVIVCGAPGARQCVRSPGEQRHNSNDVQPVY
jgi:hypothetical protein